MKNLILPLLLLSMNYANAEANDVQKGYPPMQTVEHVDLNRYAGQWYEIAKFPNWFQRKCNEATAEYTPLQNGQVEVLNTCKKYKDGLLKSITGVATVKDQETNAKLSVTFLPPWLRWTGIGAGNYWVIDLEPNYQYAVVSEPKRKYLWILSRTPSLDRATYENILQKISTQGLDISKLVFSRENAIKE